MDQFEPKIVGILCNWCSYSAADAAGASHLSHAPNVHPVRVMCTGRIDPAFVLRALKEGADGVLICGCHPGDCHYERGNYLARRRMAVLKNLLEYAGIDPRRVRMTWVSAAEGNKFAEVVTEVTEDIKKLGPMQHFRRGNKW